MFTSHSSTINNRSTSQGLANTFLCSNVSIFKSMYIAAINFKLMLNPAFILGDFAIIFFLQSWIQGCKTHGTVAPVVLKKVSKLKEDQKDK